MQGEAQAFAIEAKAKAEAEQVRIIKKAPPFIHLNFNIISFSRCTFQMSKKAAAFKEYREAAMVDMLLQTLPKVRPPQSPFPSHMGSLLFTVCPIDCCG